MGGTTFRSLNDKVFALSNHKEFAQSYVDGKANNKQDWAGKITGHPFGLYVSINKILNAIPSPKDSGSIATLDKSKAFWNDLYSTGGDMSGDALTIKTEVNLMDQNTNSLKQLNTYFDQMYQLNKDKIKKMKLNMEEESPIEDSIPMPPPPPTEQ